MGMVFRPLRPFTFDGTDFGYEGQPEFLPSGIEKDFPQAIDNLLSANMVRREFIADEPKSEGSTPGTPAELPPARPQQATPPPPKPEDDEEEVAPRNSATAEGDDESGDTDEQSAAPDGSTPPTPLVGAGADAPPPATVSTPATDPTPTKSGRGKPKEGGQ